MSTVSIKKIVIASPGDVIAERRQIDSIIKEINQSVGDTLGIKFETVKWETHAMPAMGRPQSIINGQLRIDQCDIFIGIAWMRFGTPTGGIDAKGSPYESGTQEEFDIAYNAWKEDKKPELMLFRSIKEKSAKEVDGGQLDKVNAFFKEFAAGKDHPGLYKEYRTNNEFAKLLRISLTQYAIQHSSSLKSEKTPSTSLPDHLTKYGLERIFVPQINVLRNEEKKRSLNVKGDIYLIAHSGYSFIAQFGHRFRDIVEDRLKEGFSFKAVVSNPWSESSFFASYGEMYDNINDYYYIGSDGKRYIDCVRIIEQSKCYQVKYTDSINGYHVLRKKYGDKMQIRFTRFEMMSSILLTDEDCYVEPYLPVNLNERYDKGMLTFELKVSKLSQLYKHNQKYFEFLWNLSEDFETYETHIEEYKNALQNKLKLEV